MQEAQETWVQFLGWEDTLEKEMATHSSILAWKIPWTGYPGELQSKRSQRVRHSWAAKHASKTQKDSMLIYCWYKAKSFSLPLF